MLRCSWEEVLSGDGGAGLIRGQVGVLQTHDDRQRDGATLAGLGRGGGDRDARDDGLRVER